MRPAHILVPPALAGSPVRPSSTELAGCGVVARLGASESVHLQVLSSVGVRFAEGHSVGQRFEIGSVEVHLKLIACLRVETWFNVDFGNGRVDVHYKHCAAVA